MEEKVHTKTEILKRLQRFAPELRRLGVDKIGLFGSFVRNEPHELSDVDILVEFTPGQKSFDNFMSLCFRLEDIFLRRVEVVTKESLSPHIGPQILKETEYVSSPFSYLRHILDEIRYLHESTKNLSMRNFWRTKRRNVPSSEAWRLSVKQRKTFPLFSISQR